MAQESLYLNIYRSNAVALQNRAAQSKSTRASRKKHFTRPFFMAKTPPSRWRTLQCGHPAWEKTLLSRHRATASTVPLSIVSISHVNRTLAQPATRGDQQWTRQASAFTRDGGSCGETIAKPVKNKVQLSSFAQTLGA